MPDILLYLLSFFAIASAIGVVIAKEAVYSALSLTVNLLCVGGLFLALHHQFLAVAQLLIYAGAVMVVFMFAVTTLSPDEEPLKFTGDDGLPILGVATGLLSVGALTYGMANAGLSYQQDASKAAELVPPSVFAADLFGPYLLPFEGTAFILLTALIGAVILGGRRQIGDG